MTAEDLLTMPDDEHRYELVEGELKQMAPAGEEHGTYGMNLSWRLARYIHEHKLGRVYLAETGFLVERNPDTVLAPDFSFISADRLPAGGPAKGYREGAPDLVVEVVSPSDTYDKVEEKVQRWLSAGTRLVWVVLPGTRTVTVCRQELRRVVGIGGTLDGEDVVPGFQVAVAEIFEEA
jgi:Uma2 family endonuclease